MASPALVQGMQVTVKSLLAGQAFYNVIKFSSTIVGAYTTPTIFANAFLAQVLSPWQDIITDQTTIVQLRVDSFAPAGVPAYPPHIVPLALQGTVADDALPPYVSARIYKSVDAAQQYPSAPPTPWRFGMVRISGIPETFQEEGFLTPTAIGLVQDLADAMFAMNAASFDWQIHIDRIVAGTPYWGVIDTLTAGALLGSQNTRKY